MSPSIRRLLGCPVQMEMISLGCVSWRYLRHSALCKARPQTRAAPRRIAPPFTGALALSIQTETNKRNHLSKDNPSSYGSAIMLYLFLKHEEGQNEQTRNERTG